MFHLSGLPEPSVKWQKNNGPLDVNAVSLPSGSLWIRNVSLYNQGTYSCSATNIMGVYVTSTVLHVYGGFTSQHVFTHSHMFILSRKILCVHTEPYPTAGSKLLPMPQELNRRRVLMASRRGTSVFIKPGDILRIGT